jgi:Protein of unknown function (DUF3570)
MQLTHKTATAKVNAASLIISAALALPGVAPNIARAQTAPEHGLIGFKLLSYKDWQPGLDRIRVSAPSVYGLIPFAGKWSIEGSLTTDSVSGASPRWHSAKSSASTMRDYRKAYDAKVTRYYDRASFSVGGAFSTEHDYVSRAISLGGTVSTENNNTTFSYGLGFAHDSINPVNNIVVGARKNTKDILLGVTQVLTSTDIAQLNLTVSNGRGYYSDPYKLPDSRPDQRKQIALKASWNHHFVDWNGTSRLSYRFYHDSFKVNAHTITAEYVKPLPYGFTITPLVRLHSQSAAFFYFDPVYDPKLGAPFPPGYNGTGFYSADHRLSAFGGRTLGLRITKAFADGWSADMRYDHYAQRGSYRLFGTGSPSLDPFNARFLQFGVSKSL